MTDTLSPAAGMLAEIREGLGRAQKELPPKYFYDERGSRLFEQITELPEYYPTRVEQQILDEVAADVVAVIEPKELVELGPGSARKTHALLDPMVASEPDCTYVPVDVSESAIRESAARLSEAYGGLAIHGVVADFEQDLERLEHNGKRRLIAFLGGTLGNFDAVGRRTFLKRMHRLLRPGDGLLIGTDLVKDKARLEAAYNDSAGVTAEFNRNVLRVINSNLDADFEPERFEHVAFYDERAQQVEMRLRADEAHAAHVGALDMDVELEDGEEIRTEISCKFTRSKLFREYARAGLDLVSWHTDADRLFALSLAAVA
jgi:L-histidine Nalpha-methyltransferase